MVGIGDTFELLCSTPASSVSPFWYKDGLGLSPTNRTHIGQKLLKIINVSYSDSGLYSCRPRHSVEILRNFTVRVIGEWNNVQLPLQFSPISFSTPPHPCLQRGGTATVREMSVTLYLSTVLPYLCHLCKVLIYASCISHSFIPQCFHNSHVCLVMFAEMLCVWTIHNLKFQPSVEMQASLLSFL